MHMLEDDPRGAFPVFTGPNYTSGMADWTFDCGWASVALRGAGGSLRSLRQDRHQQHPPRIGPPAGNARSGSQPHERGPQSGVNTRPFLTVTNVPTSSGASTTGL